MRIKTLKKAIREIMNEPDSTLSLKEQIRRLKDELADLKTQKKMEEREIKQLVKIKEEKLQIEHEKRTVELQGEFAKKEMNMQQKFHDLTLKNLDTARTEMKDVYDNIMKRLPNVNVDIKKGGK